MAIKHWLPMNTQMHTDFFYVNKNRLNLLGKMEIWIDLAYGEKDK